MEVKVCQSCAMPMTEEEHFSKNADGTLNLDYCCYCFINGAFAKEETMEEMIETCVPFMVKEGEFPSEESAREKLMEILPNLKRWKISE